MAITPSADKTAIQKILQTDSYLKNTLKFEESEVYGVKATDALLNDNKRQIFVYNEAPEHTYNPIIFGSVYQIDVSVPVSAAKSADNAMEQIVALLHNAEVSPVHRLELLDPPTILSSETSLYQVGVRFVCYSTVYTKKKV